MSCMVRKPALLLALALCSAGLFAQESKATAAAPQKDKPNAEQRAMQQPAVGGKLAEESNEAAGEENAQFKQSPSVKWLARHTGIPLQAAYWVFIAFNFAIVAFFIVLLMRSRLPGFFQTRTGLIRSSMEEARRSSEEARARLTAIESRLQRMDAEISEMRAAAEREAAGEEERIRAAAEDDKRRILATTEQEIDATLRLARRELKAYTAELAVKLAEGRIRVDAGTDRALVHNFTEQFGKDGQ